jgi:predicted nucleic acid-binding protein
VTTRRIVLDANILIRAVLGTRVRELIEQYGEGTSFLTPDFALAEAIRNLPIIAEKRGVDPAPLLESLDRLRAVVEAVPVDVIAPLESAALARIGARDPMDWPIVAAALTLECPIWTEDRDFFGAGVATWTSDLVEIYRPARLTRHDRFRTRYGTTRTRRPRMRLVSLARCAAAMSARGKALSTGSQNRPVSMRSPIVAREWNALPSW